jgi:hypothetical protein
VTFVEAPTNSQIQTSTNIFTAGAARNVVGAGAISVFDGCNLQHPSNTFPDTYTYRAYSAQQNVYGSTYKTQYSLGFYSDAQKVEVVWINRGSTSYRVWVDDKVLSSVIPVAKPVTGTLESILIDFSAVGGAAQRRFRVDLSGADFVGIVLDNAERSIWPAEQRGPTVFWFGDSLSGGSTISTSACEQIPNYIGNLFAWDNVWNLGNGGTGYTVANAPSSFNNNALSQIQYLAPSTAAPSLPAPGSSTPIPDIVVIAYGHNDPMNSGTATAAGTAASAARSQWPNARIILIGPLGGGNNASYFSATETQISSAVAPYVNATISMWQGVGRPWMAGTGNTASPTGDGNSDIYIGSDNTHWTDAGIAYMATRLAPELRRVL